MIKNIPVLAALSLTLLIGFWGCSNVDSTLSPTENLTVESVGVETMLSKPKGHQVNLTIEFTSGKLAFELVALIFTDGFETGDVNALIEGVLTSINVFIPDDFPVRGRLRIDKTKSGIFRVQLNVKGREKGVLSVQLQYEGTAIQVELGTFRGIGTFQVKVNGNRQTFHTLCDIAPAPD